MTPFDEDWHALSLSRQVVEMLRPDPARHDQRRRGAASLARLRRLAARAAERVDQAVHAPSPGRYRAAHRSASACAALLLESPLPPRLRARAHAALRLQLDLLAGLAAGRRAARLLH